MDWGGAREMWGSHLHVRLIIRCRPPCGLGTICREKTYIASSFYLFFLFGEKKKKKGNQSTYLVLIILLGEEKTHDLIA